MQTTVKSDEQKSNSVPAGAGPLVAGQPSSLGRLPYHRSITGAHLSSGGALRGIGSYDNLNVAWVTLGVPGAEERLQFIVRACNSHDDLLAALHQTVNQFDTLHRLGVLTEQQCADCTRFACAAISKAEA